MQIQLKQKEIEAALRDYILKIGIRLDGRTLAINFVSGRKENGLTADLFIEDNPVQEKTPEPSAEAPQEVPPPKEPYPMEPVETLTEAVPVATEPAPKVAVLTEPETQVEATDIEPKKPFSLFN